MVEHPAFNRLIRVRFSDGASRLLALLGSLVLFGCSHSSPAAYRFPTQSLAPELSLAGVTSVPSACSRKIDSDFYEVTGRRPTRIAATHFGGYAGEVSNGRAYLLMTPPTRAALHGCDFPVEEVKYLWIDNTQPLVLGNLGNIKWFSMSRFGPLYIIAATGSAGKRTTEISTWRPRLVSGDGSILLVQFRDDGCDPFFVSQSGGNYYERVLQIIDAGSGPAMRWSTLAAWSLTECDSTSSVR